MYIYKGIYIYVYIHIDMIYDVMLGSSNYYNEKNKDKRIKVARAK